MKVVFFEAGREERDYFSKKFAGSGLGLVFTEEPLDAAHLPAVLKGKTVSDAEVLSVFVGSMVSAEILGAFPRLRLIATRSTGYDHLDLAACAARGITVANVPTYGEYTVAEFAFGLILTLSRKLYEAYDQIREAGNFSVKGLRGFDLRGKTLGVVGTGNIGRHAVNIAKGFGMNVVAYDVKPDESFALEAGFAYKTFEDVLRESDIVTLHVPYLPATHHLINRDNIGLMKEGAYLVNTSRGAIVETEALVRALKNGRVGGAGLDVLEEEGVTKDEFGYLLEQSSGAGTLLKSGFTTPPKPDFPAPDLRIVLANHVLIDMPNVIVTPHNAFNTDGAWERIAKKTAENIMNFAAGKGDIARAGT